MMHSPHFFSQTVSNLAQTIANWANLSSECSRRVDYPIPGRGSSENKHYSGALLDPGIGRIMIQMYRNVTALPA